MLDDLKKLESVDRGDMLGAICSTPQHLSEGYKRARASGPPRFSPDAVVVCGLGGSAIGGDMLRAWLGSESDLRCEVSRGYSVPRHVGHRSLVIVASYSGDTEETLSMLEDARRRSARIVTISSGGRLADMADSLSLPHVEVPAGLVPRASFGYVFGSMLGTLERIGAASPGSQLEEGLRVLADINGTCGVQAKTLDNPAKRLAHELHGTVPVVVGHGLSAPVARRWANQMNENAKSVAFSSELPEMDHNEIVFWASDPRSQGFSAVFLDHDACDERMRRRLEATRQAVCARSRAHVVMAAGRSPLAQMLSLVMVGDYVSVYSAVLRGVDPSTTEPIEALKAVLAKK